MMKRVFFLIGFAFLNLIAGAQDSAYEKTLNTFIEDVFGKEWFQEKKLAADNLSDYAISKIISSVQQYKTKSKLRVNDSTVIDTLLTFLSSSELKLLNEELNEKGKELLEDHQQ